jgi:hypothetical protein
MSMRRRVISWMQGALCSSPKGGAAIRYPGQLVRSFAGTLLVRNRCTAATLRFSSTCWLWCRLQTSKQEIPRAAEACYVARSSADGYHNFLSLICCRSPKIVSVSSRLIRSRIHYRWPTRVQKVPLNSDSLRSITRKHRRRMGAPHAGAYGRYRVASGTLDR